MNSDTVPSQDERSITVQEEPRLHLEPHQRDVTNVKRSGEWLNMESRNLVPGDLMKLTFRGFIPAVLTYSRSSKTARANVQEVRLESGRALTLRFVTCCRHVLCFVQGRGAVHDRFFWSCVARTYWQGCVGQIMLLMFPLCLCSSRLQQSAHRVDQLIYHAHAWLKAFPTLRHCRTVHLMKH